MKSTQDDPQALQASAAAGDAYASAQLLVAKWNLRHPKGTRVFYTKSALEGKCRIRTTSEAYVFGDAHPAVDIEAVGMVLLASVELDTKSEIRKSGWFSNLLLVDVLTTNIVGFGVGYLWGVMPGIVAMLVTTTIFHLAGKRLGLDY